MRESTVGRRLLRGVGSAAMFLALSTAVFCLIEGTVDFIRVLTSPIPSPPFWTWSGFRPGNSRLGWEWDTTEVTGNGGNEAVLCLGDGATAPGDSSWPALLAASPPGLEAVNLGREAYGLDQSLLLYREKEGDIPHQLVILAVTGASVRRLLADEAGGWPKPRLAVADGGFQVSNAHLVKRSALGARVRRLLASLKRLRLFKAFGHDGIQDDQDGEPGHPRENPDVSALVTAILDEIDGIARSRGRQLAVIYLPGPSDTLHWRRHWIRGFLGRESRRLGWPFLDLTEPVWMMDPSGGNVFPEGITPGSAEYTPYGHAIVAELVRQGMPLERLRGQP